MNEFLTLLRAATPAQVFNPWRMRDASTDLFADAPARRLQRLREHLATPARYVLIGEAAGYQGCKVSGLAFTSERLLLEGSIPRVAPLPGRLTSRARPWSEPSATTVWKTLHALGMAEHTVLWNAYPWHPHKPEQLHSNRTPTRGERIAGVPVLESFLRLFPRAHVFAVGRNAEAALAELALAARPLRHPSMGGAAEFARQLRAAIRRD
ncbi:MAG: uracil-DNA glycosylase [Steroidobacteraceae bacterium]